MIDFMPAKKPTMRRTSLNTRELLLRSTGDLTYARRRKTRGAANVPAGADVGTAKAQAGADAGTANAGVDTGTATANAPAGGDAREANMQTDPATQWMQRMLHRYVLYVFHTP